MVLRPGEDVTGDVRSCSVIDVDGVASNFMPVHASCHLNEDFVLSPRDGCNYNGGVGHL